MSKAFDKATYMYEQHRLNGFGHAASLLAAIIELDPSADASYKNGGIFHVAGVSTARIAREQAARQQ